MSELITVEELKSCKLFMKSIKIEKYDYSDIDYNLVREAILLSSLTDTRLKQSSEQEYVHIEENGNCYIESELGKIAFEEKYYPMVSLAVDYNFRETDSIGFLKEMLNQIKQFFMNLKNFSGKEKQVKKIMLEYIENLDKEYLSMRKSIMEIESQYDNKIMELLFLLPDLILYFVKFLADKEVSMEIKMKIIAALLYIILPLDVIPEQILGPIGYIDDVYIAIIIVVENLFESEVSEEKIRKYWPGKIEDLLSFNEKIKEIEKLLGKNLIEITKKIFQKRNPNL